MATILDLIVFEPLLFLVLLGLGCFFVYAVVWCATVTLKLVFRLLTWVVDVFVLVPVGYALWLLDPRWIAPHQADLPAEVVACVPPGMQRAQETGLGTGLPAEEGEAHLSVSAATAARLRPRARWVRALDSLLGARCGLVGRLVRGWWVPDLPAAGRSPVANALLANLKGGARLLGGGVIHRKAGDEGHGHVYYVLELASGETLTVFPELLSRLQAYSCFRRREEALVPALRARGVDWCRSSGLPCWVWPMALPSAVALSMRPFVEEETAQSLMGSTLLSEQQA